MNNDTLLSIKCLLNLCFSAQIVFFSEKEFDWRGEIISFMSKEFVFGFGLTKNKDKKIDNAYLIASSN